MFLEFAILSIILIVVSLIFYARWNYGILESLNIPIVPRTFFLGSTPDLHKKIQHFEDIARFEKYGSVYGVYEGRLPVIYICDPELIRLIFVKDFDYFHNRREIDLGDPLVNDFLDFLPIEKWREIRSQISPIFTSNKLRQMSKSFQETNEEFYDRLKEVIKQKEDLGETLRFDVRKLFDGLVMSTVCRSAFKINIGDPVDPKNKFVKLFKDLQGIEDGFGLMYTLSRLNVMQDRKKQESGDERLSNINDDFIDILNKMYAKISTPEYQKLGIKETAVMAQAINFVLAGYDAICTTLTMLLYFLAKYKDIQEKVMAEIDSFFDSYQEKHEIIPFDKINECVYLKACIQETLRLCPSFIRPERICTKDWEYNGLKIKKGIVVMAPAWAVNRHPEFYTNPNTFDPSRFLHENKAKLKPFTFLTYGEGPRGCVGMKYANLLMQYAMLHFLKRYRVELCQDTVINYKPGVLFLIMYDPVYLKLVKRQ